MDKLMRRLNEQKQYLESKNEGNQSHIQINFCSIPLNNGVEQVKDYNNEYHLEKQEQEFEDKLKLIFSQDINQNVPGVDTKDEDEEEEVDDGEDLEYEEQIEMSVPIPLVHDQDQEY